MNFSDFMFVFVAHGVFMCVICTVQRVDLNPDRCVKNQFVELSTLRNTYCKWNLEFRNVLTSLACGCDFNVSIALKIDC